MRKIAVGLGIVLLLALGWWLLRGAPEGSPPSAVPGQVSGSEDATTGPGVPVAVPGPPGEAQQGRYAIVGTVLRDGVPAPARVEVWLREPWDPETGFPERIPHADRLVPPFDAGPVLASADAGVDGRFRLLGLPAGRFVVVARGADGRLGRNRTVLYAKSI